MPFPIAHSLTVASLLSVIDRNSFRQSWKLFLIGVILGNLPDLDFCFVWFMHGDEDWHRGFAHSLPFAALIGIAAGWIFCHIEKRQISWYPFGLFTLLTASHGVLDTLTTASAADGVELLSPFTRMRFAVDPLHYQSTFVTFRYFCDRVTHDRFPIELIWVPFYELLIFGILFAVVRFISSIWLIKKTE